MKKFLFILSISLIIVGTGLIVQPDISRVPGVSWFYGVQTPVRAVIVYESRYDKPLPQAMVEVLAKAPSLGVSVWDKDVLGKGKQPSPEAKPFFDAAGTEGLPKLVLQWKGGSLTAKPCPTNLDELRKAVGK